MLKILNVSIAAINIHLSIYKISNFFSTTSSKGYITVTGVHGVMESLRSPEVREAHRGAWLTVPDGMPLVYIGKLMGHKEIGRCYGPELMLAVMGDSVKNGYSHFFYGGREGVAQNLKLEMEKRFPGVNIVGVYTPPFRPLNAEEKQEFIARVKAAKPNIIWVGLSTPKQELFMHEYLPLLETNLMIGVGAAFDIHTGSIKSAPRIMQKLALEWLYRIYQEPRRLWKRYFINNPLFIWNFLLQVLKLKKFD